MADFYKDLESSGFQDFRSEGIIAAKIVKIGFQIYDHHNGTHLKSLRPNKIKSRSIPHPDEGLSLELTMEYQKRPYFGGGCV